MSQSRHQNQQAGFTLVELSVVLIVIGLLVVSILKGATMVHDARVRKTAQMVEDIRTASNLFYREQGRLAGDGQPTGIGILDGLIKISGVGASEPDYFRKELIDNRYLNGKSTLSGADKWKNALGGEIWVEYRSTPAKLNYIVVTGLAADEDRRFVDMQFDDGEPSTGNVRYDPPVMLIPL